MGERKLKTGALLRYSLLGLAGLAAGWLLYDLLRQRSEDEVWGRIQASGVMVVATDASYPPFEALDADGNFFGFDIDLAEELGRRLGVRVEFENIAYDGLLGTLVVKRDDVVISAFVPVPERLNDVSYTDPYFNAGPVLVVREDSGLRVEGEPREWTAGKTIAAEFGSNGDALVRQWSRLHAGVTPLSAPSAPEAMVAVESGAADAALVDAVSAYDFLLGHPALTVAGPPVEDEFYVIAVNRQSEELLGALNAALDEMELDGTMRALREKWFGKAGASMGS